MRKAGGSDVPAWLFLQLPCWMSLARPETNLSVLPRATGWKLHGDGDAKDSLNQRHISYSLRRMGDGKDSLTQRHIFYSLRSSAFMPINQSGSKSLRSKWFLILWKLTIHASKHPNL